MKTEIIVGFLIPQFEPWLLKKQPDYFTTREVNMSVISVYSSLSISTWGEEPVFPDVKTQLDFIYCLFSDAVSNSDCTTSIKSVNIPI
jgi:hypothetical protein